MTLAIESRRCSCCDAGGPVRDLTSRSMLAEGAALRTVAWDVGTKAEDLLDVPVVPRA